MLALNAPSVLAELATLHDAYELALVANDVEALGRFFWHSPDVVRYGVTEQLYGADELAAYRRSGPPVFTERRMVQRKIVAFGADFASVMSEYEQKIFGSPRHSRQSQVWVRFAAEGWKIVAAHVSNALASSTPTTGADWARYLDEAAAAIALPIAAPSRGPVVQTLQRTAAIAAPLLAFRLPDTAEPAPVFHS